MKKLGIGVIGLGRIFLRHYDDSIKQLPEIELVAVCDNKKSVLNKYRDELSKDKTPPPSFYTDYQHLIDDKRVDVVTIATPNGLHNIMGMAVAVAQKHCIMEKPISQNFKDAQRLVNAFKKSKGKLFPVLQVRYNPAVQTLRSAIKKGLLGKILTASVIIRWTRPQEYFDESDWKGTLKMDGGTLLTQAIHYVDIMQYVLGPGKSVFGKLDRVAHKIEAEDIANAIIDLKTGTRVNLEFTVCTYPHNLECSLTVLGEKGTVKIGGTAMNKCELWEVKDTPMPYIPEGLIPNVYAGGMYVGSCPNHKSIYENMINNLVYKKESFLKAEDALESLRIIDGIKKSSEMKKEVIL
ncbi:hypothetical protein A2334_05860 [Candidatus Roizmanbacteria bacterium RIFOXYB2_FULL_38_10]|uniref:Oxidoreductase n=1 Tax=Candidatus Roizmanbacteria bacterium RIFOXYD1_FULL_38_12 TaxID=1802093 RepID=A0A1F7L0Z6_9BACT|nr:MAG: hypothetical protein A3K47_02980 [Candidatus Roizmanbacteria bacterium RIFOXYA2_FULL_38_14]OGK63731.1 MAG: hypothetical protein A3K27_02980 [Candidatus Roizmanbacteria bacterium RIFOXYA1_FULL_37_12]OGK65577.1 MAG: hypothetical protein A3K38_02980 [Candidatus Roizmanbacteria bacterium RIFOXYB1_FULL_40_23]OGK68361.1 MAG: hypothetical protein A2334_05860 [Candidatus Roizmanbacteria bacterium RIFOXYB2_FULL_38_10]OGK69982.1 MAG: hypothetical protein A3K21_02985 [Candidatus Roizmanbacteria ba